MVCMDDNKDKTEQKTLLSVALNEVIIEFLAENRAEIMSRAKAKLVAKGIKVEAPSVAETY